MLLYSHNLNFIHLRSCATHISLTLQDCQKLIKRFHAADFMILTSLRFNHIHALQYKSLEQFHHVNQGSFFWTFKFELLFLYYLLTFWFDLHSVAFHHYLLSEFRQTWINIDVWHFSHHFTFQTPDDCLAGERKLCECLSRLKKPFKRRGGKRKETKGRDKEERRSQSLPSFSFLPLSSLPSVLSLPSLRLRSLAIFSVHSLYALSCCSTLESRQSLLDWNDPSSLRNRGKRRWGVVAVACGPPPSLYNRAQPLDRKKNESPRVPPIVTRTKRPHLTLSLPQRKELCAEWRRSTPPFHKRKNYSSCEPKQKEYGAVYFQHQDKVFLCLPTRRKENEVVFFFLPRASNRRMRAREMLLEHFHTPTPRSKQKTAKITTTRHPSNLKSIPSHDGVGCMMRGVGKVGMKANGNNNSWKINFWVELYIAAKLKTLIEMSKVIIMSSFKCDINCDLLFV